MENENDLSATTRDSSLEDLQKRAKDIKDRNEQTSAKLNKLKQQSARLLDPDTALDEDRQE